MKEIREFMYDGTGLCPKCGAGLIPVPYYRAQQDRKKALDRIVSR